MLNHHQALSAGVDEAGRGPWAGPVYAAAVILQPDRLIEGLEDSKQLSVKKREALFDIIQRESLCFAIASASVEEIDEYNILQASMLAMKRAVDALEICPSMVWVDGNRCPDLAQPCRALVKGDQLEPCISAASIIAKVTRDRIMDAYHYRYKAYQFNDHKGYGTVSHYDALFKIGPSPIHRLSFNLTKQMSLL